MNDIMTNSSTMTSLDIAEITGKSHSNVMAAIRKMEKAWEKIGRIKFNLSSYTNQQNKQQPCYLLTKTECLYIATKFNDEARAKLVLRWEQLEKEERRRIEEEAAKRRTTEGEVPQSFAQALLLAAQQQEQIERQQIELHHKEMELDQSKMELDQSKMELKQLSDSVQSMEKKVTYVDKILSSPSTCKVVVIAQDYGMSAFAFNQMLHEFGVQYKSGEQWLLYSKYINQGYVQSVSFDYRRTNGSIAVRTSTQWTQKGRFFLYGFLKARNVLPVIERQESEGRQASN